VSCSVGFGYTQSFVEGVSYVYVDIS
jgi:hypothetical protein